MRVFAARHGYDGILFGRRSQENTVKAPIYKTNDGRWYCHPLRDWTKVQIWEYFKVHSIPIPWIYSTHFGKHEGNAPFYSMRPEHNGGYDKCWELSEVLDPRYHRGMLQ
jgi:3'-phosphoadenosine 5'-phosphosulfate sulfotransferase (PAPS reductase)/FAD synthetase